MFPSPSDRRLLRTLLLLTSALLGAAAGYAAVGGSQALLLGAAFPTIILGASWVRRHFRERRLRGDSQTARLAQLTLLGQVCRTDARRLIRDRYDVAARYPVQYDPDSAQRELMERITQLYRNKDNAGAEAMLCEALGLFGGSPYVAARYARMLLQDLRIEEARAIIGPALARHPEEISLLILRDGVARADQAVEPPEVAAEIQCALGEMVEWAGMQLELIVGRTGAQLHEQLDVVVH